MTTAEDTLTTLGERRRQLADRLAELSAQAIDITDDIASARQDWVDSVEIGEDSTLLAQRVHIREAELLDNRQAAEHLQRLLTQVDAEAADILARAQLADDTSAYHAALRSYAEQLPSLPDCMPAAVEVIGDALNGLLGEIDGARTSHDQLAAAAVQLRQRADQLGAEIHAPAPPDWATGLNGIDRDGLYRQLSLSLMQQRGQQSVLAEISRVILLSAAR